jgi:putative tryptophan/tyrosine transport system substrate-binding protein
LKKRGFVFLAAASVLPLGAAMAQGMLRRIGVLSVTQPEPPARDAFRRAMHELGWVEGRNVEIRYASAEGDESRLDALAAELVASGAEVLVTSSAVSTRALQKATTSRPIVMVNVVNPVANGFAASLARPGGNITGLTNQQEDLIGKQLEVLLQLVPRAQRIGFVFNPRNPNHDAYRVVATSASRRFGVAPLLLQADAAAQLPAVVQQLKAQRAQGVVMPADPLYTTLAEAWIEALAPLRLPVVYGRRYHLDRGGLLSYGTDFVANWRSAARFVDRILKGAPPGELPIEQPTRFELVINLKAARAIGLEVPRALLLRADEVIE